MGRFGADRRVDRRIARNPHVRTIHTEFDRSVGIEYRCPVESGGRWMIGSTDKNDFRRWVSVGIHPSLGRWPQ